MKKILLIATGGTIASKPGDGGLTPAITSAEILSYVPHVVHYCHIDTLQLFNLDSTNICKPHWLLLAECIKEHYDSYDGFVVTHGTDTMAYTAAALSYLIQNNKKPVVLTGSQKSIYLSDSDARTNLTDAIIYATHEKACGIHIVFDGKIILGTRARKTRTKSYNAFKSIDFPDIGIIRNQHVFLYIEENCQAPYPDFYDDLDDNVFVLRLIPGISAHVLHDIGQHYKAVVIESFGVGGIPSYSDTKESDSYSFEDAIEEFLLAGKTIIMSTQVPHEGSDMEVYQVGYTIKEKYELMEAYSMTTESIVTKLMWILAQTDDPARIRNLFYTPIRNDIITL